MVNLNPPKPKLGEELPEAASVSFRTTNDLEAITDWFSFGKIGKMTRSKLEFGFTEEYGPRFKKALQHAVKLCGGKPSVF